MQIDALFFDGKSSDDLIVSVEFFDDKRVVVSGEKEFESDFDSLEFSSRLGNTIRVIKLENAGVLHSLDNDKIDEIIKKLGNKISLVYLFESKAKYAFLSVVLIVLSVIFFLTIGADMTAKMIANVTPQSIKEKISITTLETFDKYILKESRLKVTKQKDIQKIFKSFTSEDEKYKLHFRRGMGINAFALPSGDIVILDELVKFSDGNMDMIYGVLAHEKGHVALGHSMQIMVKSSIVGALTGYFTGDFSSIVGSMGGTLLQANYSREYEKEADMYAKKLMIKHGKDPKYLAEFFTKMSQNREDSNSSSDFFASHPSDSDRVKILLENNIRKTVE